MGARNLFILIYRSYFPNPLGKAFALENCIFILYTKLLGSIEEDKKSKLGIRVKPGTGESGMGKSSPKRN